MSTETRDPLAAPPNPQAFPRAAQWDGYGIRFADGADGMTMLEAAALHYAPQALDLIAARAPGDASLDSVASDAVALAWDLAEAWLAERQRRMS